MVTVESHGDCAVRRAGQGHGAIEPLISLIGYPGTLIRERIGTLIVKYDIDLWK